MHGENNKLVDKYSKIISIDDEVEKSMSEKERIESETVDLVSSYSRKKKIYDRLLSESAIYDEAIELAEFGFYKSHFDYSTSESFKEAINEIRLKQKEMIKGGDAVFCPVIENVTADGSKAQGKKLINKAIRLSARAFNNECDVAIAKVKWNNVGRLEAKMRKSREVINKLGESTSVSVSEKYLEMKIAELRLTHEYHEKKQQEKEEQAEIRRQMREDAKLEKDALQAEREEEKFKKLLEKAEAQAKDAAGASLSSLKDKIKLLKADLEKAHERCERAKSMAQQTKRGHVYVISNIGSFGKNVYKIGMTRRLDPLDRVKELGDASVPFFFDVHAMIHTEDAPALEKTLHKEFDEVRLNLVNTRREFFAVTLKQIQEKVRSLHPRAEFIETAEARHYHESQAMRAKRNKEKFSENNSQVLPDVI
ncbi:MAG: DUF4041 domain-containing protein [Planctomycetes bacterium]|nr:DUF4041 domain-containing protein [Planctomycetota bacterium]